jgi:replicative DNA helicase
MAKIETEAQFVAFFWQGAQGDHPQTSGVATYLEPEALEHEGLREAYRYLRDRYVSGKPLEDFEVRAHLSGLLGELYGPIYDEYESGVGVIRGYAAEVLLSHRARLQARELEEALAETKAALESDRPARAAKVADRAVSGLINIHNAKVGGTAPQSREEYAAMELARMDAAEDVGVELPWRAFREELGVFIPGDLVGITAYSNSGKSLLAASLFNHFTQSGTPCIAFPTDMPEGWLSRCLAADSGVPQMIAERRQWALATEQQRAAYRMTVEEFKGRPWELVNRRSINVREVMARSTVLRRKYSGKPVVVIVDHLHRLDYGHVDPDVGVGDATKRLRDWAGEDDEGGIILLLLYQPRKPSDEIELYRPVLGHQVRGKSSVWNELDFQLSPHRRWVKCDTTGYHNTAWGSPVTLFGKNGEPDFCKPGDEGGKVDDQHMYIKLVKRRVGGEGPTVMLEVDKPSGRIYERQQARHGLVALP